MKIGVMGGTFDPVHLGHLAVAGAAREALSLDEVRLVPAGQPLLKPSRAITPAKHRLAMLRLAITDKPHFRVSTIEVERTGPSYTVDTIAALGRQHQGDEIYFILGWGNLAQLPQWREPARLVRMCSLVAVPRPGWARPDMASLEAAIPGISQKVIFLDKPYLDISASAIRKLVAKGEPIEHLVPGPVAEYIRQHQLYLEEA